jgi:hypothetical protein
MTTSSKTPVAASGAGPVGYRMSWFDMDETNQDNRVVLDLANLLCVLLAQPDAETAIEGMYQVAHVISDRAQAIQNRLNPPEEEEQAN